MKSWSRSALIFFAYSIALLHTAVPHHHAETRAGQAVVSHNRCIFSQSSDGLLQKVLATDLGVGHLEIFKKGGDANIEFSKTVAFIATSILPASFRDWPNTFAGFSGNAIEKLKRKLLLSSVSHLRAPPVY